MSIVEIVSFGYLHAPAPKAHLTVDLRAHFRDPHVSPELRYMTANDAPVRDAVMSTPGIAALVEATAAAVAAFASGPSAGPVVVADGCAGGPPPRPDLRPRAGRPAAGGRPHRHRPPPRPGQARRPALKPPGRLPVVPDALPGPLGAGTVPSPPHPRRSA